MLLPAATAAAEPPCGPGQVEAVNTRTCVPYAQWLAETEAQKTLETVNREHEERKESGGPPTFLNVRARNHPGRSAKHPGYTTISIDTNRYVEIEFRLAFTNGIKPWVEQFREGEEASEYNEGESEVWRQQWSCNQGRYSISYRVTASGVVQSGEIVEPTPTFVKRGRITIGRTHRWCREAKVREAQERAAARRRYAEEVRRTEEAERESARFERERIEGEVDHFETNCRAIGGIPVTIDEGSKTVCKSPQAAPCSSPNDPNAR